jgi:glucosamine-6-phosphate deaminase
VETFKAGLLNVHVFDARAEMGAAAAAMAAAAIREAIRRQGDTAVVFASAPSQNETLDALAVAPGIDWPRITAFHMDEYLGATADAPHSFRRYLAERLFTRVPVGQFHGLHGETDDPEATARGYAALLAAHPPQVCLAGIGENGHLAFNDPPVADFSDPLDVKVVELDRACREQQVADGAFATLDDVPRRALTLTVPRLFRIPALILSVPGARKREAVRETIAGPISTDCPASILRTHANAHLFLDRDSAALARG